MYDLSGVYYQLIVDALVFGLVGVLFLLTSRFWIPEKKNKKDFLIGLICIVLCAGLLIYHGGIINDYKISMHEGEFVEERRENPYLFRKEYCFSNGTELKPLFYLDIFSKKKIYPADFEEGVRYRIYYEEKTDIIVKVEKLE